MAPDIRSFFTSKGKSSSSTSARKEKGGGGGSVTSSSSSSATGTKGGRRLSSSSAASRSGRSGGGASSSRGTKQSVVQIEDDDDDSEGTADDGDKVVMVAKNSRKDAPRKQSAKEVDLEGTTDEDEKPSSKRSYKEEERPRRTKKPPSKRGKRDADEEDEDDFGDPTEQELGGSFSRKRGSARRGNDDDDADSDVDNTHDDKRPSKKSRMTTPQTSRRRLGGRNKDNADDDLDDDDDDFGDPTETELTRPARSQRSATADKRTTKRTIVDDDDDDDFGNPSETELKSSSTSSRLARSQRSATADKRTTKRKVVDDDDDDDDDDLRYERKRESKPKLGAARRRGAHRKPKVSEDDGDEDKFLDDDEDDDEGDRDKADREREDKEPAKDDDDDYMPTKDDDDDDDHDEEFDDDEDFAKKTAAKRRGTATTKRRKVLEHNGLDDEDDGINLADAESLDKEEDEQEKDSKPGRPTRTTSATSRRRTTPRKTSTKRGAASASKKSSAAAKKPVIYQPADPVESFPYSQAAPECLAGVTFVFSGVLDGLGRDESLDYVKTLGGRVTSAVSRKTDYLVCGSELEDGREVSEGAKHKKASELGKNVVTILYGHEQFYSVVQQYSNAAGGPLKDQDQDQDQDEDVPAAAPVSNPYSRANPYAKSSAARPAANPYSKKPPSLGDNEGSSTTSASHRHLVAAGKPTQDMLWTDKYAPQSSDQVLGNQDSVRKLSAWLARWDDVLLARAGGNRKPSFSEGSGPFRAALLSGPPGIGKTTTATLVTTESGRELLEFNASDTRSKKSMTEAFGDITGSQTLSFAPNKRQVTCKKRCIVMDEVDGMGAGDRSGMAELIKMIKSTQVPIICICNDRQNQKVKTLAQYCLDLRFRRPTKSVISRRAVEVGRLEGLRVEPNAAEAIAESCGNDIRQVITCLQMWSNNNHTQKDMTFRLVKEHQYSMNKDEMLRVSLFDATKLIVEGRKGIANAEPSVQRASLYKRTDAFFVEYSLMGLQVHQNYLRVITPQFQHAKRQSHPHAELAVLERMYEATKTMSDFAVAEHAIRSGNQLWELLPFCSALAVQTGFFAGGEQGAFFPGFPDFTSWMGKNSTRGKRVRLLKELTHHMNYRVSGGSAEIRLRYLPPLRERLLEFILDDKSVDAIDLMDDYGLDRDDVVETLDEFLLDSKAKRFASLDSKAKAAFTREYNAGVHKSQALVQEQGVGRRVTRSKTRNAPEESALASKELDAVNDDDDLEQEEQHDGDDDSDYDDMAAVKELFKKRGSAGGKKGSRSSSLSMGSTSSSSKKSKAASGRARRK